jgi:hypothetical protein
MDVARKLRLGRQRVLRGIERDLAESDPRLAALFSSFTLLVQGEQMPSAKIITAEPLRAFSWPTEQAEPHRAGEGWRRALLRSILYGPLAMTGMPRGYMSWKPGICDPGR